MKGKNPNLRQKKIIKKARLNVDNWLVVKNPPGTLVIKNRITGNERELYDPKGGARYAG